jgi:hypothetical protein
MLLDYNSTSKHSSSIHAQQLAMLPMDGLYSPVSCGLEMRRKALFTKERSGS